MIKRNGRNMEDDKSKEVAPRATRRTFSREYKLAIVREAEEARKHGGVGALLRREGLYSSTLVAWRREFSPDGEVSLEPKWRGPKPRFTPEEKKLQKLERENERLRKKLAMAEALLDLQKKAQAILADFQEEGGNK
jgi:transposase-like protein